MRDHEHVNPSAVDRLNSLLTWWGVPNVSGAAEAEAQMKRVGAVGKDINQAIADTAVLQLDSFITASERLTQVLRNMALSREPLELMAAPGSAWTTLLENATCQLKTWAMLAETICGYFNAMVREPAASEPQSNPVTAQTTSPDEATAASPAAKAIHRRVAA